MGSQAIKRTRCRLCDSKDLALGARFAATPPGEAYTSSPMNVDDNGFVPLDLYLCSQCSNIQLGDVIDSQQWYGHFSSRTAYSIEMPDLFPFTEERTAGCRAAREHTILIESLDKKEDVFWGSVNVRRLRDQAGEDSNITAINVLANMDDLEGFASGVRVLIGQKGSLTLETGYGFDLLEKKLVDVVHHDHLSYFTLTALERFFRQHLLRVTDVIRTESKGGTLRCIVRALDSEGPVSGSVKELLSWEAEQLTKGIGLFEGLNKFIDDSRQRLGDILEELGRDGRTVAAFGASVGSTTMIYTFGLGKRISCIFDDNPRRSNLFSPGNSIPVYHSGEMMKYRPDYILILAWRYADAIMKKYPIYKGSGGSFITCMPDIRIYKG